MHIITMPIGFAGFFAYWTILITCFTFYTLASLELTAESIEDPPIENIGSRRVVGQARKASSKFLDASIVPFESRIIVPHKTKELLS